MNAAKAAWERIKADLLTGKNVELYILVGLAAVLIILNAIGEVSDALLTKASLAVLTLLGIALLKLRHQIERVEVVASQAVPSRSLAADFFRLEDDLSEIEKNIRSSRVVWLWGAVLTSHIPHLVGLLGDCMEKNGLEVKVLLLKEFSPSVAMAAYRAPNSTASGLNAELRANIERLQNEGSTHASGNLEVRVIDYLSPYTLYAYDPKLSSGKENPGGRIELRLTTFRGSHYMRPSFALAGARDEEWYAHFCNEFEKVWGEAEVP